MNTKALARSRVRGVRMSAENLVLSLVLLLAAYTGHATDAGKARLDSLLKMLPDHPPFTEWLDKTGETPPDYDHMVPDARVRSVLEPRREDGQVVTITTPEAWREERERLMTSLRHWFFGTYPEHPGPVTPTEVTESVVPGGIKRTMVLRFGPGQKARLYMELYLPNGSGPFPVFMTQDSHRMWAMIAFRRGYAAVVYAGADSRDDTDSFMDAWPEYDWSKLLRRGWAAGRCLDYLETLSQVDMTKVVLTGHSRNGKASLMGAAVDERISAVISSSSGVGGSMPSRECGEHQFAEGIENITRVFDWFHNRWRFFAGWEHLAPVDTHHLVAMTAPRPCLLSVAENDDVENMWTAQRVYLACRPLWSLYGREQALGILWRPGDHDTHAAIIEQYLDWCDIQFGRRKGSWHTALRLPWDWEAWKANYPHVPWEIPDEAWNAPSRQQRRKTAMPPERRTAIRETVRAFLGIDLPQGLPQIMDYGKNPDYVQKMLGQDGSARDVERQSIMFGDYLHADLYALPGGFSDGQKHPAVLWLPPWNIPSGYSAAYRRGEPFQRVCARAGYIVFCFDPIGMGRRVREAEGFYDRYPESSLLGFMVRDAVAALDAMEQHAAVDRNQIYVAGYALGALVALHLAAVDERPAGWALACPPLPFRLDTDPFLTGGIARWSRDSMLLPQLGLYEGKADRLPYDLDDLYACVGSKPLAVVSPRFDRFAPSPGRDAWLDAMEDIARANRARVVIRQPHAYNHFDETAQRELLTALQDAREP
ncbi:MAG TPA: alpha/beta fold hydrolase [Candidatus Hydrogenedentes bacterium]|nr:alpha/beta fold hydrolase [Candidatus Hydrogenedentota bacterium]HOK89807.1 alpha/beta fold hydrolase [Candidatus Hydrogenedentota bacterium]